MKIISKGLGEGKTYDLVKLMLEPGNEDVVFVAPTRAQAQSIGKRTAVMTFGQRDTPELAQRFISAAELPNRKGRKERYVIDEIDGVIEVLMGEAVIAIAGTDEDVKAEHRKRRAESPHPPQGSGVKADSKGRLTGAQPETRYLKRTDPDGTITYVPEVPKEFDEDREVTWSEFEAFFGVTPDKVVADGIKAVRTSGSSSPDHIPGGILITYFVTTADGKRLVSGNEVEKRDKVIRIRKEEPMKEWPTYSEWMENSK